MKNMKKMNKTLMIAGVALSVVAGFASRANAQGKTAEEVYLDKCAVCHGPDGAGKTAKGRKLKVKDVRETAGKMTVEQMIAVVTKGKDPDMDAFGKELGDEMVKQIVAYYRGLAKK
ncbi:MAG TPA: cytochrome c [Vicinamibacterales bacterium]|nr:cytochrome c [Vicinamibacterales bacterium]